MITEIKNEYLSVKISKKGAELQSVKMAGREYLWQADPAFWAKRAPVLFPVIARNLRNEISVDGVTYPMQKHGLAKDAVFKIENISENSVTLLFSSDEETKKSYPFDFNFRVTYSVSGKKLTQSYEIENTGDKELYYSVGAHPALSVGGHLSDWEVEFEIEEDLISIDLDENGLIDPRNTFPVTLENRVLKLNRFKDEFLKKDTLTFERIKNKKATLYGKGREHGIIICFDDFPSFAIWTHETRDADYVCLEPWQGMGQRTGETTSLENRFDIVTLPQGKTDKKSLSMELF